MANGSSKTNKINLALQPHYDIIVVGLDSPHEEKIMNYSSVELDQVTIGHRIYRLGDKVVFGGNYAASPINSGNVTRIENVTVTYDDRGADRLYFMDIDNEVRGYTLSTHHDELGDFSMVLTVNGE